MQIGVRDDRLPRGGEMPARAVASISCSYRKNKSTARSAIRFFAILSHGGAGAGADAAARAFPVDRPSRACSRRDQPKALPRGRRRPQHIEPAALLVWCTRPDKYSRLRRCRCAALPCESLSARCANPRTERLVRAPPGGFGRRGCFWTSACAQIGRGTRPWRGRDNGPASASLGAVGLRRAGL